MIFDYTLLTSFLLSSLLLLIVSYTYYLIRESAGKAEKSGKAEQGFNNKKVDVNCRLIVFIILIIIISRTGFIITFPDLLQQFGRNDDILSMRMIYLFWQLIIIFTYIYFLFRIFLQKRLKDDHHYAYLHKTFIFYAVFVIIDLVSSFILYYSISYELIFPVGDTLPSIKISGYNPENSIFFYCIFIALAGFIVFFIRIQKKRTLFNFLIFRFLHIITIIIVLYYMYNNIGYFFAKKDLLYTATNIFSINSGFSGLIWLMILYAGLAGQAFAITIIRWKDKFINKQIAINYTVQLSRLSFVSVICLTFIAVLPNIFILIVKLIG